MKLKLELNLRFFKIAIFKGKNWITKVYSKKRFRVGKIEFWVI